MGRGRMSSCLIFIINHLGLYQQEDQTRLPSRPPTTGLSKGEISTECKTQEERELGAEDKGRSRPTCALWGSDIGDPHRLKESMT